MTVTLIQLYVKCENVQKQVEKLVHPIGTKCFIPTFLLI